MCGNVDNVYSVVTFFYRLTFVIKISTSLKIHILKDLLTVGIVKNLAYYHGICMVKKP